MDITVFHMFNSQCVSILRRFYMHRKPEAELLPLDTD